ncbi:MAG TPA: sugar phosphate isomerase/epimerase [Acidobacteriaceae bacterium]|jgi:inosose dehydratase|nr:sugar phosphate isomerase/epimerase [Acidobacteriaceae bacterium]
MNISRRNFIASLSLLPAVLARAQSQIPANKNIKWAVSSNLWGYFPGSKFTDMFDVMSATGFPGIRLANFPGCLNKFGMTAAQLQTEMSKRKLNVVTISWNSLSVDPAMRQQTLDSAREAMKFLADFGASHLVVFSPGLNRGGTAAPGAFEEMCKRCNEIGELAGTMGFTAGVHNHMGQMVQTREEIDRFMSLVDPKLFGFSPDTAHLDLAGCDVVGTIEKYKDRIKFLDYKDAKRPAPAAAAPAPAPAAPADGTAAATRPAGGGGGGFIQNIYDLGDGEVDFPGCHRILKGMKYKGWICVDLDIARLKPMADYVRCGTYVVNKLEPIYL